MKYTIFGLELCEISPGVYRAAGPQGSCLAFQEGRQWMVRWVSTEGTPEVFLGASLEEAFQSLSKGAPLTGEKKWAGMTFEFDPGSRSYILLRRGEPFLGDCSDLLIQAIPQPNGSWEARIEGCWGGRRQFSESQYRSSFTEALDAVWEETKQRIQRDRDVAYLKYHWAEKAMTVLDMVGTWQKPPSDLIPF